MKAVWPGLNAAPPPQLQALEDPPQRACLFPAPLASSLRAGGTARSHSGKWERPDGSPLTRDAITHTPKPSQLDVRFAKPNAGLMRSTLSPRRSWERRGEGSSVPRRPGEGLQTRGKGASQSLCPSPPAPHRSPPLLQQGPQAFAFPPGGSFGSQMWSSRLCGGGGKQKEREGEWPLESNRCVPWNLGSSTRT